MLGPILERTFELWEIELYLKLVCSYDVWAMV